MKRTDITTTARTRRIAVAATLAVLGIPACSGQSSGQSVDQTTSPDADADAAGERITIVDFAFGEPLTVVAGTTVQVVNDDGTAHTVTADDGSFDTGILDAGDATELTMNDAGEFAFFCDIHTSMTGTITVTG